MAQPIPVRQLPRNPLVVEENGVPSTSTEVAQPPVPAPIATGGEVAVIPGVARPASNQVKTAKVNYKQFDPNRVMLLQEDKKQIPKSNQFYYIIPGLYAYGQGESKAMDDLVIEGPELYSSRGLISAVPNIKSNDSDQNSQVQATPMKEEHTITAQIDVYGNEEQKLFAEKIDAMVKHIAKVIMPMRGRIGFRDFNADSYRGSGLADLIVYQYDTMTNEKIPGKKPNIYFKAFKRGSGAAAESTIFSDLNKKPIPWVAVSNVEMKFIPLWRFKRIFAGSQKIRIQMELISAVITWIKPRNDGSSQHDTIDEYVKQNPSAAETVDAMLSKIMNTRMTLLEEEKKVSEEAKQEKTTSTPGTAPTQPENPNNMANLQPNRGYDQPAPQQMPMYSAQPVNNYNNYPAPSYNSPTQTHGNQPAYQPPPTAYNPAQLPPGGMAYQYMDPNAQIPGIPTIHTRSVQQ